MICDAPGCRRGLIHVATKWADPCPICKGSGRLTLADVSRLLGETPAILTKLSKMRGRMRPKTCVRILDATLKVLHG
jgi:hypothetical protein